MGRPKKIEQPSARATPTVMGITETEVSKPITIELTKEQKEKKQRLLKVMNEVNREHKSIILGFAKDEPDKEKLPFGIPEIDTLTGNGGIAGNYIIIWGSESVGKSTLALNQAVTAQRNGKICAYLDLEHAFDKGRALMHGINLDDLVLVENIDNAEEAMNVVIKLAKEQVVDLIIVDSIQAMSPKAENEGKGGKERMMEEDEIALLAKKMGKFLRRTSTPIYKAKIGVTLIGQSRTGGIGTFATHEELTGGRSQKHWSLLTLFIRKGQNADAPTEKVDTGELDENDKPIKITKRIGFDAVLQIQKTKTNSKPEGSELHIPFYFASGFLKK
jgi:recombination protein RecA